MPVEYSGMAQEHLTVRTRGGWFDVSHMGEIAIEAGVDDHHADIGVRAR